MNVLRHMTKIRSTHQVIRTRRYHHIIGDQQNAHGVKFVDLRSDTVTKPSNQMKEAMMMAEVGDDVLKEDPTILALEKRIADMTGKEAGLFVASGTMGNLLSVLAHCSLRGSEAILGSESHIFNYEQANIAQFGGILTHALPNHLDGTFNFENLEIRRTDDDFHSPTSKVVCIENTVCRLGGIVLPQEWIDQLGLFCKENGVSLHMDGARVFNACTSSGVELSRMLLHVDSASICLSKGLGCPVGSLVVGSQSFIKRVEQLRKAIGGGWRQAGILAACGLHALENNIQRLSDDHKRANHIAKSIDELKSSNFFVKMDDVQSNMLLLYVNPSTCTPQEMVERMASTTPGEEKALSTTVSVLAFPMGKNTIRMVTHLDLDDELIDLAVQKIQFIIKEIDASTP